MTLSIVRILIDIIIRIHSKGKRQRQNIESRVDTLRYSTNGLKFGTWRNVRGIMINLVPRTQLHPTQFGLGISQATHCEVIHVSTVYSAKCNFQLVYLATPQILPPHCTEVVTRNHSTDNACCCFFSSVTLQMMTVLSISEMILGLSWEFE